jgi:hypothetical protein
LRVDDILVCPILLTGDVNACSASATVLVTCLFVGIVRVRWTRGTGETRNISFEAMATVVLRANRAWYDVLLVFFSFNFVS